MSSGRIPSVEGGIQPTVVDAKGDLIVATAADTVSRLAVGSNDQVLTADSTTATGLKWATASSGGPNYTLLNSGGTSLSGSTTTISGISGKNSLMIVVRGASSTTDNDYLAIRFNSDSGSNYRYIDNRIEVTGTYDSNFWNVTSGSDSTWTYLAQMDNSGSSAMYGQLMIDGCNASGVKPYQFSGGGNVQSITTGSGPVWYWGGGVYLGTSTISSVSLITGNSFDAGTVFVYGA